MSNNELFTYPRLFRRRLMPPRPLSLSFHQIVSSQVHTRNIVQHTYKVHTRENTRLITLALTLNIRIWRSRDISHGIQDNEESYITRLKTTSAPFRKHTRNEWRETEMADGSRVNRGRPISCVKRLSDYIAAMLKPARKRH